MDSSPVSRTPACRWRNRETARARPPCPAAGTGVDRVVTSALHVRPLLGPRRVVGAYVPAAVQAVGGRRGPVPDLVREGRVRGVVGVAERRVAGLAARLRLRR